MISKEKFNELKSEKKKIYYLDYGLLGSCSVKELDFSKRRICDVCADYFPIPDEELEVHDYCNIQNDGDCDEDFVCYLKDCYETQEDAEEFLKYGNITKIFKFPFVSYDDFLKGKTIEVENVVSVSKVTKFDCIVICDMVKGKQQIIDYATRENYHKALDIAKNLFLGEDKNEN